MSRSLRYLDPQPGERLAPMTITGETSGVISLAQRFITMLLSNNDRPFSGGAGGLLEVKLSASPDSLEAARNAINLSIVAATDALKAQEQPDDPADDRINTAFISSLASGGRDTLDVGITIVSESGQTAATALGIAGG